MKRYLIALLVFLPLFVQANQAGPFSVGVHLPEALTGEEVQGLPPYAPTKMYRVSDYPNAPASWHRGNQLVDTYFIGVEEGDGMWLDLRGGQSHSHEVAAIVSVQGVNAITALPVEQNPVLEQYRYRCPLHPDTLFVGNRYCPADRIHWPAQNYLSSVSGATMWIDGFRTRGANGNPLPEVRQFIFTSETSRGIANQVMGEDRTFTVDVYFYEGPRKRYTRGNTRSFSGSAPEAMSKGMSPEVGGGAPIRQEIGVDPGSVHRFGNLAAMTRIYYVYEDVLDRIVGERSKRDGALNGLIIGNPEKLHKTY